MTLKKIYVSSAKNYALISVLKTIIIIVLKCKHRYKFFFNIKPYFI